MKHSDQITNGTANKLGRSKVERLRLYKEGVAIKEERNLYSYLFEARYTISTNKGCNTNEQISMAMDRLLYKVINISTLIKAGLL